MDKLQALYYVLGHKYLRDWYRDEYRFMINDISEAQVDPHIVDLILEDATKDLLIRPVNGKNGTYVAIV
jgi:hypothetical protein